MAGSTHFIHVIQNPQNTVSFIAFVADQACRSIRRIQLCLSFSFFHPLVAFSSAAPSHRFSKMAGSTHFFHVSQTSQNTYRSSFLWPIRLADPSAGYNYACPFLSESCA
jgi:hypothetical protein